jgi:hypothetical protein
MNEDKNYKNFLIKSLKARRQWNDIFKLLKEQSNTPSSQNSILMKTLSTTKETFSDK